MDSEFPEVFARHLMVCRGIRYDVSEYGSAYSLENVHEVVRAQDDYGYPLIFEYMVAFTQLFGAPGLHRFRLQLVRVEGDEEVVVNTFGPLVRPVRPSRFVTGTTFPLLHVEFPEPGVYELRLFVDGQPELLTFERILAG